MQCKGMPRGARQTRTMRGSTPKNTFSDSSSSFHFGLGSACSSTFGLLLRRLLKRATACTMPTLARGPSEAQDPAAPTRAHVRINSQMSQCDALPAN